MNISQGAKGGLSYLHKLLHCDIYISLGTHLFIYLSGRCGLPLSRAVYWVLQMSVLYVRT